MKKNLVFFDIDGTLLPYGDDQIADHVIASIQEAKKNGNEVFICTGRCQEQAQTYIEQIGADSYICSNGQHVVYQGKLLYNNVFSNEAKHEIVNIIGNGDGFWGFETIKNINLAEHKSIDKLQNILKGYGILDISINNDYTGEDVYQFWAFGDHVNEVKTKISDKFHYLQWNDEVLEIMPSNESKAKGIEVVTKMLQNQGIKTTTYAFGDGVNDIEMLQHVDHSVAMGNAEERVKNVAKHVSTRCDEDGINHGLKLVNLI